VSTLVKVLSFGTTLKSLIHFILSIDKINFLPKFISGLFASSHREDGKRKFFFIKTKNSHLRGQIHDPAVNFFASKDAKKQYRKCSLHVIVDLINKSTMKGSILVLMGLFNLASSAMRLSKAWGWGVTP
jgi:hypothetical protein